MTERIKLEEIYDKNINFLIGSGASVGLLPTLALRVKDEGGNTFTIETLSTRLKDEEKLEVDTLLFMHYYKMCIEPAMEIDFDNLGPAQQTVLDNYISFLRTVLYCMGRSQSSTKNSNIFTTNYDGCIVHAADRLIYQDKMNFVLNDGARGFRKRYLHARNFNSFTYETGIFNQHKTDIPQINLINVHGSVYWKKHADRIQIDYLASAEDMKINVIKDSPVDALSEIIDDDSKVYLDVLGLQADSTEIDPFWAAYKKLPIVNPTKWKFYETVFEEHYYQMLRLLSYELEKKNTVLITFGFSFSDEHILHLVQRSLSNPTLQLYVCCFNESEKNSMETRFSEYPNVVCIAFDEDLDFTKFNSEVFTPAGTSGAI